MERGECKKYFSSSIKELSEFDEIAEIVSRFMLAVGRMHPFKFEIPLHHDKGSFTFDIYLISIPVIEIYFSAYVYERKYRVENNVCRLIYDTVRIDNSSEKDLSAFSTLMDKLESGELRALVIDKLRSFVEFVISVFSPFVDECMLEDITEVEDDEGYRKVID